MDRSGTSDECSHSDAFYCAECGHSSDEHVYHVQFCLRCSCLGLICPKCEGWVSWW